ncbi:MAG: 4'-phosphopantetheinyl transferase superfamily protein, partial [bacterium]
MRVGIDLVRISEIRDAMSRRERFRTRLFSDAEVRFCDARGNPSQHYAARFALKEAFFKATGYRGAWREVEVVPGAGGAPALRVAGVDC